MKSCQTPLQLHASLREHGAHTHQQRKGMEPRCVITTFNLTGVILSTVSPSILSCPELCACPIPSRPTATPGSALCCTPPQTHRHASQKQKLYRSLNLAAFTSTPASSQTLFKFSRTLWGHAADTSLLFPSQNAKLKAQSCEPRAPRSLCALAMAVAASITLHSHLILLHNTSASFIRAFPQPQHQETCRSHATRAEPICPGLTSCSHEALIFPRSLNSSPPAVWLPRCLQSNAQLGWMGARLPAALLGTGTAAPKPFWMLSFQPHKLAANFHQDNIWIPAACNQPRQIKYPFLCVFFFPPLSPLLAFFLSQRWKKKSITQKEGDAHITIGWKVMEVAGT